MVWVVQSHAGDLCESLEQNSGLQCPCFVLYFLDPYASQHRSKTGKRLVFSPWSQWMLLCIKGMSFTEFHLPTEREYLFFFFQCNSGNRLEIFSKIGIFLKFHIQINQQHPGCLGLYCFVLPWKVILFLIWLVAAPSLSLWWNTFWLSTIFEDNLLDS